MATVPADCGSAVVNHSQSGNRFSAPSKDAMSNVITLPNYIDQIQQEDLRIRYAASAGLHVSKHLLHVRIHPMSIFVPSQLLSYSR